MTTPTIPDDIFERFQAIDKDLSSAMACLALGRVSDMLEKLHRAQALSHSLNFRLEADRLPPGSVRPISTLYTTPETALCGAADIAPNPSHNPEQAALL